MEKKHNWQAYKAIIEQQGIKKLYHFTDRDNLHSIIQNGGLYSWADCEEKGITIAKPGGSDSSRSLDARDGLQHYVRVSFVTQHPMMYIAMNEDRISNPVLVKNSIPLEYITNINNFGIPIPTKSQQMQIKLPYTAQITRKTPTAFIFLIDHSVSMQNITTLYGEEMTKAEAAARIVNAQINELVLRCIKMGDTRHYYDIAVIGYGEKAYSGWQGELEGRDFVSPEELKNHPYTKIVTRKEIRTRKGVQVKEVEQVQWISARHDGSWTHYHEAFDYAKNILDKWMIEHHEKDCYPPTIIHITDGWFNHASLDTVIQKANELKAMFTNDGNVILFNIHFTAEKDSTSIACPISKQELDDDYSKALFDMSSLLPERYNADIARCLNDTRDGRHVAMGVNADATTLIKLMDIGTPTNISQNQ